MENPCSKGAKGFDTTLLMYQKVKSNLISADIGSDEILSQSNYEIERCANFMKKKDESFNTSSFRSSCVPAIEQGSQETSKDTKEETLEVFALFIYSLTWILRFFFKHAVVKVEQFIKYVSAMIESLGNQFLGEKESNDNEIKASRYWLCIPITFLIITYGLSMAAFITMKILMFKFPKTIKEASGRLKSL